MDAPANNRLWEVTAQETTQRMTDVPPEDRPRERLLRLGTAAMTDAELVAILLRTGVKKCHVIELARRLIEALGPEGLPAMRHFTAEDLRALVRLHNASVEREDRKLPGIGDDKIATLLAALEFGARVFSPPKRKLREPLLVASQVVACFVGEQAREVREGFWMVPLDNRRALIGPGPVLITKGLHNQTLIDVATLFRRAIALNAVSLYVVHNHPSGDVRPSTADIETTRTLIRAGRVLNIPIRDHIILGRPDVEPSFFSFRANACCDFV